MKIRDKMEALVVQWYGCRKKGHVQRWWSGYMVCKNCLISLNANTGEELGWFHPELSKE